MNTVLTLLPPLALALGAAGLLARIAPRMEGRARVVLTVMVWAFAAFTAALGFGVGGVGAQFPGWQAIGQAAKILFYAAPVVLLITHYVRRQSVSIAAWGGLAAYGLLLILAGQVATVPGYSEALLYPVLLALTGALAVQYVRRTVLLRAIRGALLALCVGSLVYLVAAPALATSNPDALLYTAGYAPVGYTNSTIGLSLRLHGLASHPNTLGYIAAAAMLLGLHPALRYRREWAWQGVALAALFLSQSKTMWVAAAVALAFRAALQVGTLPPIKRALSHVALLGAAGAGVLAVALLGSNIDPGDITLTGRTTLWQVTLGEWTANPLAGYGPQLWYDAYRTAQGYAWAGQAHNQVVQALGQAGYLGLLGLLLLLAGLFRAAWLSRVATGGASLALVALLVVRGVSETPLRFGLDVGALVLLAVYLVATTPSTQSQ